MKPLYLIGHIINSSTLDWCRRSVDIFKQFVLDPEKSDIIEKFSSELFTTEELYDFRRQANLKTRTLYDLDRNQG